MFATLVLIEFMLFMVVGSDWDFGFSSLFRSMQGIFERRKILYSTIVLINPPLMWLIFNANGCYKFFPLLRSSFYFFICTVDARTDSFLSCQTLFHCCICITYDIMRSLLNSLLCIGLYKPRGHWWISWIHALGIFAVCTT